MGRGKCNKGRDLKPIREREVYVHVLNLNHKANTKSRRSKLQQAKLTKYLSRREAGWSGREPRDNSGGSQHR